MSVFVYLCGISVYKGDSCQLGKICKGWENTNKKITTKKFYLWISLLLVFDHGSVFYTDKQKYHLYDWNVK